MRHPVAFGDDGLGNSSYLVEPGDGRPLVLDPSRRPGGAGSARARRGIGAASSVETHLHADVVSGSRESAALGAQLIAPRAAGLESPADGPADADEVKLGGLVL